VTLRFTSRVSLARAPLFDLASRKDSTPQRIGAKSPPMQMLKASVNHSRTSDLHPVMAAGCRSTLDAVAQCALVNSKERHPVEPTHSNHLFGFRFGVGLDGHRG